MFSYTAIVLAGAIALGQAEQTKLTRKHFEDFGKLVAGRWMGKVTLVYNWPEQDYEKGDTITAYQTHKWIADKNAIEMEGFTGNVTGKSLIFWDAPSERIIGQHIGSSGMTWRAVLHKKKGRKWTWKFLSGGLADGQKLTGTVHWTFSEDGDELHLSGKAFVGKGELDPLDDHYRRVSD